MIDPKSVAFFVPAGLKDFKQHLFDRIGQHITRAGGRVIRHQWQELDKLPANIIPVVGCSPYLSEMVYRWRATRRPFAYWDRGYFFRVFATWLPRGDNGGMYRWHLNSFQMNRIRDVPPDRFNARVPPVVPWSKGGRHILIAAPTKVYAEFHGIERWTDETIDLVARATDRPLMIRCKASTRPLGEDLKDCHAVVSHGSNAAVEAVIMGCPAFVHADSAAALLGNTDLTKIETPVYADRQPWLNSLAYSQWNERELCDGTLFRMLT